MYKGILNVKSVKYGVQIFYYFVLVQLTILTTRQITSLSKVNKQKHFSQRIFLKLLFLFIICMIFLKNIHNLGLKIFNILFFHQALKRTILNVISIRKEQYFQMISNLLLRVQFPQKKLEQKTFKFDYIYSTLFLSWRFSNKP